MHRSTVSWKLKRNITKLDAWPYKHDYAHTYTEKRKRYKPKRIKMTTTLKGTIIEMLKHEWSPKQISGYAKKHRLEYK